MEFIFMEPEFLSAATMTAGLLVFVAVTLGVLLFGNIADEEARGRRIVWLDEPLATAPRPVRPEKVELRKAA